MTYVISCYSGPISLNLTHNGRWPNCKLHSRFEVAGEKLTEQRKLWASFYITHFDAKRAALEAGYPESSAGVQGRKNEACATVGQYVAHLMASRNKRLKVDADYVLSRLIEIDELDVGDLFDYDGNVLPVKRWPKVWRRSVSGVDFERVTRINSQHELKQIISKIKWPDKVANLKLIGEHVAVKAWDKESLHGQSEAPPLQITFEVAEPKAEMAVTNAQT